MQHLELCGTTHIVAVRRQMVNVIKYFEEHVIIFSDVTLKF